MLPANAASFKVINFSPELISGLKQMDVVKKSPIAKKLLNSLKPGLAFEATLIENDAIRSITVADFSANTLVTGLISMLNEIKR